MSLFAGIYVRNPNTSIQNGDIDAIKQYISRNDDPIAEYSIPRLYVAKIDLGIIPEHGFQYDLESEPFACIAGQLFFDPRSGSPKRSQELRLVTSKIIDNGHDVLKKCVGTFALCIYDPTNDRLILSTDRFGARPIYYCELENFVLFANSLRVMESIPSVPKRMNIQSVAEMSMFGYPLADRTPYSDVNILVSGESIVVQNDNSKKVRYTRWDRIALTSDSPKEFTSRAYDLFLDAIRYRSEGRDSAVALLSGGLDSRCISVALNVLHRDLFTVTFETRDRVDSLYATQFAKATGIRNILQESPHTESVWNALSRFQDLPWPVGPNPTQNNIIFSGDGGSVGVGFVYVDEELMSLTRNQDSVGAAQYVMKCYPLLKKMFQSRAFSRIQELLQNSIEEEFSDLDCEDKGREAHLFFMNNDQRRHLHPFFENIDVFRIEYMLPFMDGHFVDYLMSLPSNIFLGHSFYHKWVNCFPKNIMKVPWQTYPGHLKCPIVAETTIADQWVRNRQHRFRGSSDVFWNCLQGIYRPFPSKILRRPVVLAALLAHGLRIAPYGHVFDTCWRFQEYFRKCDGKLASL